MTMAIRNGDLEVVRTLLDLGADVNGSAVDPWSPLDSAVHNNNVALARLFIERGANVNAIGKTGYTPLLLAASIDFGDTEMMELLLKAGARARRYQESRRTDSTRPRARVPTHTLRKYSGTPDRALTRQEPFEAVSTAGYTVTIGRALDVDGVIERTLLPASCPYASA